MIQVYCTEFVLCDSNRSFSCSHQQGNESPERVSNPVTSGLDHRYSATFLDLVYVFAGVCVCVCVCVCTPSQVCVCVCVCIAKPCELTDNQGQCVVV